MSSMYQQFIQTILPILPELIVITAALLVLVRFFLEKEHKAILGWYSLAGVIIAAYVSSQLMGDERDLL